MASSKTFPNEKCKKISKNHKVDKNFNSKKSVSNRQNLEKTFELAQEIENICLQYINALRIGVPKILSKKEMQIVLGKMKNYKRE